MSLSNFHDVDFPIRLALGARGGPERRTEIVPLASGGEARNAIWSHARRRWDVSGAVSTKDTLHALISFFEARRGPLHGFRFRDFLDDRSCPPNQTPSPTDQIIGTGDSATTRFQLVKTYGDTVRDILKPVISTVQIAFNGVLQNSFYTVDYSTGMVSFDAAPASGVVITAGFQFDCAARFETDRLEAVLQTPTAGHASQVSIVELVG